MPKDRSFLEILASAHAHKFYHLVVLWHHLVENCMEYLHRNPGWTDTDPKKVCLSPEMLILLWKMTFFRRKKNLAVKELTESKRQFNHLR